MKDKIIDIEVPFCLFKQMWWHITTINWKQSQKHIVFEINRVEVEHSTVAFIEDISDIYYVTILSSIIFQRVTDSLLEIK